MLDYAEVLGAHAEESCAVDLGLTAYVIGLLRMEGFVVFVVPGFGGVVAVIEEDCGGAPVELLLGKEGAALQDEDALAGACEVKSEGSAASAGADDDCVVWICHSGVMLVGCGVGFR